ncbi:hypothetical protein E2C01_058503 [Portunus trituberculatus]|uniref:Uncharacterized protein n=1 Tax=Portunus trituberculatus TaxID=210409 RepID=A0A5B7H5J6_PORTR|nr:hypothetical protein [Portunus trituberculatus]
MLRISFTLENYLHVAERNLLLSHLKLSQTQYRKEYITSLTPLTLRGVAGALALTGCLHWAGKKKGKKVPPFTLHQGSSNFLNALKIIEDCPQQYKG